MAKDEKQDEPKGRALNVVLPPDEYEALAALAESLGHSVAAEAAHAIRRHVAKPPRLVVPELDDARPDDMPERKRGRPPGGGKKKTEE